MQTIMIQPPPALQGNNAGKQVAEIYAYLRQMAEQLNYALEPKTGDFGFDVKNEVTVQDDGANEKIAETQATLRQLIIKTAEIVHKEIQTIETELKGSYEAISDEFGTYREDTDAKFKATNEGITQSYESISTVESALNSYIASTQAYIRTGLLYYDDFGNARYGLAIGENLINSEFETRKYAVTLVGNRLSFWEQGIEVAYISNQELHIKDAVFEGKMQIGNWIIDHEHGGFTIRWNGETEDSADVNA